MHAEKIGHGEEEGIEVRGASRRGRFAGGEDEGVSKGDLLRGLAVEERVGLRAGDGEGSRRQHRADEIVDKNLQAAEEEEDGETIGRSGADGHGRGIVRGGEVGELSIPQRVYIDFQIGHGTTAGA